MEILRIVSDLLDSNTFVLKQNDEAIIIDAGAKLSLVKPKVDGAKVFGVLLTHGHYDHAMHCLEYASEFGCKVYAASAAKEYLSDAEKNYGKFKIENFEDFCFFDGDQTLDLGSFKIFAHATPGHSKCGVCYLIGDTIFAGDLIFKQGVGRTDLFGCSKREMLESLKKVQSLQFSALESGHGEGSTRLEQERNLKTFIRFLSR